MSATEATKTQPVENQNQLDAESSSREHDAQRFQPLTTDGVHLQINFAWSKYRNTISIVNGETLTPLYIQHFGWRKPNLRFHGPDDTTRLATGTINSISIAGECTVNKRTIEIKPLSRLKTEYNYLSHAFAHPSDPRTPVALSWIANMSLKTWDFVCLDEAQMPVAKMSANWWKLVEVGNIYFEKSAGSLSEEQRNEIVVTGITIFYIMVTRVNNPFNLLGAAFAKPGKVGQDKESVELENRKDR